MSGRERPGRPAEMDERSANPCRRTGRARDSGGPVEPARTRWVSAAVIPSLALAATVLCSPRPVLLWNASASTRVGLYAVSRGPLRTGDIAVARAPPRARRLAASRDYLPASVPLVKRVAATSGDRVCASGRTISINGRRAATRRSRDPLGRALPWWSGCEVLHRGDLFLLSPNAPAAFDGRYFGITRAGQVIGKARLLWAR